MKKKEKERRKEINNKLIRGNWGILLNMFLVSFFFFFGFEIGGFRELVLSSF